MHKSAERVIPETTEPTESEQDTTTTPQTEAHVVPMWDGSTSGECEYSAYAWAIKVGNMRFKNNPRRRSIQLPRKKMMSATRLQRQRR